MFWPIPDGIGGGMYNIFATDGITREPDHAGVRPPVGGKENQFGGLQPLAVHYPYLVALVDPDRARTAARHRVALDPMGQDRQAGGD